MQAVTANAWSNWNLHHVRLVLKRAAVDRRSSGLPEVCHDAALRAGDPTAFHDLDNAKKRALSGTWHVVKQSPQRCSFGWLGRHNTDAEIEIRSGWQDANGAWQILESGRTVLTA